MSNYAVQVLAELGAAALVTKDAMSRARYLRTIQVCLKDVREHAAKS